MSDEIDDVARVAALTYIGLKQHEIADEMNVSSSTVNRLVQQAKGTWINRGVIWHGDEEMLARMLRSLRPEGELDLDALNGSEGHLVEIRVTVSDRKARAHYPQLAAWLCSLVGSAQEGDIGVAWGRTNSDCAHAVAAQVGSMSQGRARSKIRFVPVCGSTVESQLQPESNASVVADRLQRALGRKVDRWSGLGPVPASIPRGFEGDDEKALYRYFEVFEGYRLVFGRGEEAGVVGSLAGVLTSLGMSAPDDCWLTAAAADASVQPADLSAASIGDIAGLFLSARPEDNPLVDRVNARWTGIGMNHLRACARRTYDAVHRRRREQNRLVPPGVVVIANRGQAQAALAAIRRGLVSRLYLDSSTAAELAAELKSELPV